ncbi:uncharacterized protein FA14DRAFT_182469 [Meira miltonrushii]|uniref:Uncharacterized protein n=1 Tax=Meira miltonrushii TaxID=1280837 RepID=A0A316V3V2_9BASI|nr:uncharacterized protein FA14DRAFT_182469 [Meira miltonrushii]PWN31678.1 hypothetical protein FA14DRAFT_182469 [Meira miltonrushii]
MALSNTNTASSVSTHAQNIPGAPQKANGSGNKKKKSANKNTSNGHAGKNGVSAIDEAAHAASLTEQAPVAGKVDQAVKVQPADVAEQAEHQAALEAVKIVEQNGSHPSEEKHAVSALHTSVNKRIKVLNKKLQRAIAYSELTEDKLNSDMRRIVASKGNLEGGVSELSEVLKAIEINEKEQQKKANEDSSQVIAKTTQSLKDENAKKVNTLFQFMYLYSLVNASMQAQFAPPPLPTSLQNATSEQVAAIGKLYADFSAAAEVTHADLKSTLLEKLASASSDKILGNVTFQDVLQIIEGLSSPVVQQTSVVQPERTETDSKPQQSTQDQPSILFMQASELEQNEALAHASSNGAVTNDAPSDVKQAEPEGGAVDGVATSAINGGASKKGEEGASGTVLGQAEPSTSTEVVQDGTAKAAVEEPVQTKEVSEPASGLATPSVHKVIDWSAHDDDDFGDLEMQPEPSKMVAPQATQPVSFSSAVQPKPKYEDSNAPKNRDRANNQRQNGQNQRDNAKQQRGKNQQQQQQQPAPLPKLAPQVDEDGFTVASSKRTKMLQQHQAANAMRGGRGGNNGGKGGQRYNNQNANKSDSSNHRNDRGVGGNPNSRGRGRGRGSSSGNGGQDVPVQ